MAKSKGTTAEEEPVTARSEGLEDDTVFPDAGHADGSGLDDKTVVLVEEPPSPGTSPAKGDGDGKPPKTPAQLEEENKNLRAALKETRAKGKQSTRNYLAELEQERKAREDAQAKLAATESKKRSEAQLGKLDDAADLKEAAPIIIGAARDAVMPEVDLLHRRLIRQSQVQAQMRYEDYDTVLQESGLVDLIKLDPTTGQPKDPILWNKIYRDEDDPGEAAYQIAKQLQARAEGRDVTGGDPEVTDLNDSQGDRATGRRDVVDTLRTTAARPTGIRAVPPANPPPSRRYTRRQIDLMTDEQRAKLPSDVIEGWLMGAE